VASYATGAFFGSILGSIEWLWKRNTDKPQRLWWLWINRCALTSMIVWLPFAGHLVATSDNHALLDARSWLTFGLISPGQQSLPIQVVNTELRRYKLLDMNPPKHFYVTLEDVQTKQVYERTYVSKHCNSYANNKLGDEYNISVTTYKQGDRVWLQFNNLPGEFCA
jgi:hypothetical protein